MKKLTIHADSTISVGSTITGYCVKQRPNMTAVVRWHNNGHPPAREMGPEITMPRQRYVLSSEEGRAQFDADFLAVWGQ